MIQKLKAKANDKKGFTLAELLIVVAIIAVLVAIAVPAFSSQLNKAKAAVDDANLRSATSMAVADYLMKGYTGEKTYKVYYNTVGQTTNYTVAASSDSAPTGYTEVASGQAHDKGMSIVITDAGTIKTSAWQS